MDRRRISSLGLTTILLAGVGVGLRPVIGWLGAPDTVVSSVGITAGPSSPVPRWPDAVIERCRPFPPAAAFLGSTPVNLPADASALVAEATELQLLAQGTELALEPRQWQAMAEVTLETQAVRHTYEATIATSAVLGVDRYRVEIPLYAAAGDALRARLRAGLCDRLGDAAADEILAQLGARLESRFAGFGVCVQTLDITGNPWVANSDWVLTRTVKFWNSVEGQDRLSTRRETFLPGLEDPAGLSWGPLLSVVSQQVKAVPGT